MRLNEPRALHRYRAELRFVFAVPEVTSTTQLQPRDEFAYLSTVGCAATATGDGNEQAAPMCR